MAVDNKGYAGPDEEVPPSKVVHCRGVSDYASSSDLAHAFSQFGPVEYVMMLPNKGMALVEMTTIPAAQALVTGAAQQPIVIHGRRVLCNFSKSQTINRGTRGGPMGAEGPQGGFGGPRHGNMGGEPGATHVLLFTILKPFYPITPDIIQTICTQHGTPARRVVMLKKNGVQALVEFESVTSASRARMALDGKDIYLNCCTLVIEYSHVKQVIVGRNSDDRWDFTVGNHGFGMGGPELGNMPPSQGRGGMIGSRGNRMVAGPMGMMGGPAMGPMSGPCVIVYNLDMDRFNCDRLFSLFGLYGDVVKVKFLVNKPGSALVQFRDPYGAEAAIAHLNKAVVLGNELTVQPSKHPFIAGNVTTETLKDGTPVIVDFSENRLNRFFKAQSKNRIFAPSRILHFFNAPPDVTEERIRSLLAKVSAPNPASVKLFERAENKSAAGLIEFAALNEAMDAMALGNNVPLVTDLPNRSYHLKLAFSPSAHKNQHQVEH